MNMHSGTWIISDTHFGHVNILDYEPCRHQWLSTGIDAAKDDLVGHMNSVLIEAWNSTVSEGDTVYHLGDFAMGNPEKWPGYRKRLNGRIVLIKGNHDKKPERWLDITKGDEVHDVMVLPKDASGDLGVVVMRHDPSKFTAEEISSADWLFHGHLHSGNHRADTISKIDNPTKLVCFSVERLPTQPAPMAWSAVGPYILNK